MSRLVTFGCSYTYGQGLNDCYNNKGTHGPYPSKYAWPNVLAQLLDRECINLGLPGASNKAIWYRAIKQHYNQDDIVVFLWTHIERHSVIQENGKILPIGVWTKGKIADAYFRYFQNSTDSNIELNCKLSQIKFYLDNLGIRNYHCFAVDKEIELLELNKSIKTFKTSFHNIRSSHGLGADNAHPNEDAQREFAHSLYKELKEIEDETTLQ